MSIRIDGTNTAANPGITGADADTGLKFGTDEVEVVTGGTRRVKFASNGNVGIGNLTPSQILELKTGEPRLCLNGTTANSSKGIEFEHDGSRQGHIFHNPTSGEFSVAVGENTGGTHYMTFKAGNGTEKMRIHSGGEVTKSNQPAFMVAVNANYNVVAGIGKIRNRWTTTGDYYTNVMTNVGSCWSTANTRFTAPVDGIYAFSNHIGTSSNFAATSYLGAEFYKNGSRISTGWRRSSGAGYQKVHANIILPLSEGDVVEPGIETDQAGTLLGGNTLITQYTHFLGYLLS